MLELFLSACGAGMCIALMMLILKDFYHSVAARVFLVLIGCAFVHMCHNWLPASLSSYAYMVESAAPAFFWMSGRLIFQEGYRLPRIGLFIAIYSFTTPVIKHLITLSLDMTPDWVEFLGREVQQYCEYALVIMGVFALFRGQNDDLVESRRRLRWAIMGASGLSLGWAVFSFNLNFGSATSRILAIDASILIIIWTLFKGRSDIWGGENVVVKTATLDIVAEHASPVSESHIEKVVELADELEESEELSRVKDIMSQGFYRQEKLTLRDLALELALPEYKVRKVINKELGYRNFNEFINEYRINEAAQRLISEPETPISNISLDVGYRTLSSFNRAFRKEKETTPTAYRESN
ncbi:MAG: helix-turn-helix domain-containing protein [Oleispira sp.]